MRTRPRLGTVLALCAAVACGGEGGGVRTDAPAPPPVTVGAWSAVADVPPGAEVRAAAAAGAATYAVGGVRLDCCTVRPAVWRYAGGRLAEDKAFRRVVRGRDVAVHAVAPGAGETVVAGGGEARRPALWARSGGRWSRLRLTGLPAPLDGYVASAAGAGDGVVHIAVAAPKGMTLLTCDTGARRCGPAAAAGPAADVRLAATPRAAVAAVGDRGAVWTARGPDWTWRRDPGLALRTVYGVAPAGHDLVLLGDDGAGVAVWRATAGDDWRRGAADYAGGAGLLVPTPRGHLALSPGPDAVAVYASSDTVHWARRSAEDDVLRLGDVALTGAAVADGEVVVFGSMAGPVAAEPVALRAPAG